MPEPGRERWSSVSKGVGVDKDEKHPGNTVPTEFVYRTTGESMSVAGSWTRWVGEAQ